MPLHGVLSDMTVAQRCASREGRCTSAGRAPHRAALWPQAAQWPLLCPAALRVGHSSLRQPATQLLARAGSTDARPALPAAPPWPAAPPAQPWPVCTQQPGQLRQRGSLGAGAAGRCAGAGQQQALPARAAERDSLCVPAGQRFARLHGRACVQRLHRRPRAAAGAGGCCPAPPGPCPWCATSSCRLTHRTSAGRCRCRCCLCIRPTHLISHTHAEPLAARPRPRRRAPAPTAFPTDSEDDGAEAFSPHEVKRRTAKHRAWCAPPTAGGSWCCRAAGLSSRAGRSPEETAALLDGIELHGIGSWAAVKRWARGALAKRAAVDLKDKWRNCLKLHAAATRWAPLAMRQTWPHGRLSVSICRALRSVCLRSSHAQSSALQGPSAAQPLLEVGTKVGGSHRSTAPCHATL